MHKKIILGTAQFGMEYGVANNKGKIKSTEILRILNFLNEKKIEFLDTAYSYGTSQKEIGKHFKKTQKKFKIITKLSLKNNNNIINQFETSLKLLGYTPNIVLAHNYKDYLNPNFHYQIKILKKNYAVNYFGVSLYNVNELNKVLAYKKPDFIQIPLNILDQRFGDKKILNKLKKNSIKIIARSVFLPGLFFKDKNFIFKNFENIKNKYLKLSEIAKKEKVNLAQLSLNWVFHIKEIDYIIIGIDNLKQLKQNIKNLKKKISYQNTEEIKKYNSNDNKIIKPYLWKIK